MHNGYKPQSGKKVIWSILNNARHARAFTNWLKWNTTIVRRPIMPRLLIGFYVHLVEDNCYHSAGLV